MALVFPLYLEKIHVVIHSRNEDRFKDWADLFKKKAKVNVGTEGAGGMLTAALLEKVVQQSLDDAPGWTPTYFPDAIALGKLFAPVREGESPELDAVVLVGGVPIRALSSFPIKALSNYNLYEALFKDSDQNNPFPADPVSVPEPSLEEPQPQPRESPPPTRKRSLFTRLFGGTDKESNHLSLLPMGQDVVTALDNMNDSPFVRTGINPDDYKHASVSSPIETIGVPICMVTHALYSDDLPRESHRILWIRHIIYRILSQLDEEAGLVEGFYPRAGTDQWKAVARNLRDLHEGTTKWDDFGWKRHPDPVLKSIIDEWMERKLKPKTELNLSGEN